MSPSTPIRLVALDLDGTLLDSQSQISPRTRQAIADAVGAGSSCCPAPGAPWQPAAVGGAAAWHPGTPSPPTVPLSGIWAQTRWVPCTAAMPMRPGGRPTSRSGSSTAPCRPETAREAFALYQEYHGPLSIFSDGRSYLDGTGMALFQNRHIQRHSTEARQPDDGRYHVVA